MLLPTLILSSSCSKVQFASDNSANVSPDGVSSTAISCSTYFNNQASSVSIASTSQNPDTYANCSPTNSNITWTVRDANNSAVTVNGLQGAHSVPDFFALGKGVYSVTAYVTSSGLTPFTSSPITATVTGGTTTLPKITCDVKINGQYAPVNLQASGTNPRVTAACTPSVGSYVWTVTSGANSVTVSGLTGSDSTPDFKSLPSGSYNIYLQVSQSGYQAYRTTNPLVVNVTQPALKAMTYNQTVTAQNNQLDVLLIVDDSNSMLANNQKLATRLKGFVDGLGSSGLDWQMCVTVTRSLKISTTDPNDYWGASVFWSGNSNSPSYILKAGTANTQQIFSDTINKIGAGWAGSEDERPIKAAYWSLYNGDPNYSNASGCYRKNAGLAMVLISNEDERSIGGDISQQYYKNEYYPLEAQDLPATLMSQVNTIFGSSKRFVFNSILVRPGDNACMASQDAQGTKSHYGVIDAQMANLTGGSIGSICDSDYSQSLNYFKDQIVTQMKSVNLDCAPVGNITVTISPGMSYTYNVSGTSVTFDPAVPAGRNINIQYNCNP